MTHKPAAVPGRAATVEREHISTRKDAYYGALLVDKVDEERAAMSEMLIRAERNSRSIETAQKIQTPGGAPNPNISFSAVQRWRRVREFAARDQPAAPVPEMRTRPAALFAPGAPGNCGYGEAGAGRTADGRVDPLPLRVVPAGFRLPAGQRWIPRSAKAAATKAASGRAAHDERRLGGGFTWDLTPETGDDGRGTGFAKIDDTTAEASRRSR